MSHSRAILAVAAAAAVSVGSARWALRAQEAPTTRRDAPARGQTNAEPASRPSGSAASVQDALLRPFTLPFAEDTSLEDVAARLRKALKAPVVLDLAALDRLDLTPKTTVRLELEGVRLKTGLKLLLDQVGMTYRVIPEDNLLLLTDARGSEDPLERVFDELKSLHKDVHDLQDAMDDVYQALAPEEEGPAMRKPTIIEEVPADPEKKPKPVEEPKGAKVRPGLF
jgi:hypothetical protein